jgi:hypothetical protein
LIETDIDELKKCERVALGPHTDHFDETGLFDKTLFFFLNKCLLVDNIPELQDSRVALCKIEIPAQALQLKPCKFTEVIPMYSRIKQHIVFNIESNRC